MEDDARESRGAEGTLFGRYRLIELLGRGGMGEVWRASDTVIERIVALKVLPATYADNPTYRERFRREALKAARLNHRHIVMILDVGESDGRLFLTMPVVEGRDLQTLIDEGPLPAQRAVAIIEQVGSALTAAHSAGLVHRDIKPSNVLLDEDDFAYLIDFGIARRRGDRLDLHRPDHRHLVVHGPRAVPHRRNHPRMRHLRAELRALPMPHRPCAVPGEYL
ncbi:serine/threonine-protein kinase [Mycobacterium simiae]|uniref:serine/threonine-protein kinase n=1 Tax=Mycobacterium simiae TaxID=1784 RepID=UPI0027B985E3|nr:serine/threonine-protein kinase [Mycobacterium simiae]